MFYIVIIQKKYYEIVDEARPLSGLFPTDVDLFTEIMKLSNIPSFRAIRALIHVIASQSMFEK